jgi:hypothetical protein
MSHESGIWGAGCTGQVAGSTVRGPGFKRQGLEGSYRAPRLPHRGRAALVPVPAELAAAAEVAVDDRQQGWMVAHVGTAAAPAAAGIHLSRSGSLARLDVCSVCGVFCYLGDQVPSRTRCFGKMSDVFRGRRLIFIQHRVHQRVRADWLRRTISSKNVSLSRVATFPQHRVGSARA